MGRPKTKTCSVCYKTVRGDTLKRHMNRHVKERVKKMKIDEVENPRMFVEAGGTLKRKSSSSDDSKISKKMVKMDEIEQYTDVLNTSVIVPNPNVPTHEAVHKEPQLGFGNGVEPEKEKNPQMEPEGDNKDEFIDKAAFNEKLFTREYKHKGSHDILLLGKKYKTKIMNKLEE